MGMAALEHAEKMLRTSEQNAARKGGAMVTCKLCGKEITAAEIGLAWKQQTVWVNPHGAKGATLAESTGDLAHQGCISLAKLGIDTQQEALL